MFLEKIKKLGEEWGVHFSSMEAVAKESLLYGMRLIKTPGRLKKELKKVGIDSTLATPMWSGNAYLLITLPKVLFNRNIPIPSVADLLFAQKVLNEEQLFILKNRYENIPSISTGDILTNATSYVRKQSKKGRFLPFFDSMYESTKDVEQDLLEETLKVINKELTNFRTHRPEDMNKYISNCLGKKAKTYFKSRSPRMFKAEIETPEELEKIVEKSQSIEPVHQTLEIRQDLQKMLPKEHYKAISLLMGFASEQEQKEFDVFLANQGKRVEMLTPRKLKTHIEKHIGKEIFTSLKEHKDLIKYLKA